MAVGDHSSKQYDQELEAMRSRVLEMGGLVESQLKMAIEAFERADSDLADRVIQADRRVNELEIDLDRAVHHIIARHLGGLVADALEVSDRLGDESAMVARAAKWLREKEKSFRVNRIPDIRLSGDAATIMLHKSLDAFARMDAQAAAQLIDEDESIDERFRAVLRQLITFMMEDPRAISASLDTVWAAKAIERIGDHAKNIAEHVIFIAYGADVRHATPEERRRALSGQ